LKNFAASRDISPPPVAHAPGSPVATFSPSCQLQELRRRRIAGRDPQGGFELLSGGGELALGQQLLALGNVR